MTTALMPKKFEKDLKHTYHLYKVYEADELPIPKKEDTQQLKICNSEFRRYERTYKFVKEVHYIL